MPIVINEFEIMVEPPKADEGKAQSPQMSAESSQLLRPEDIIRVQRRHYERLRRVRAD